MLSFRPVAILVARCCRACAVGGVLFHAAIAAAAPQAPPPATGWVPSPEVIVPLDSPDTPGAGSRFGFAIAMNDTYAVVGAPDARIGSEEYGYVNGAGAAYVFKRVGSDWVFQQRLVAPVIGLAQTGCAVAIDPDTSDIVVGAWAYSGQGFFTGGAFYYKKNSGDSWGVPEDTDELSSRTRMPTQNLKPADLQSIDSLGFSVAISGDTIAVGSPLNGASNAGAVYIFERVGSGAFVMTQKLQDEAGGANDQMGTKIALDGNLLVCGVQNDDVQGKVNAGSVLIYRRATAGSSWTLDTKLTLAQPVAGAQFGASVAARMGRSGQPDYVAVGAPTLASGAGASPLIGNGIVFVYRSVDHGAWVEDGTLLPREDNPNNNFGYSLAMSMTDPPFILAGSPGYDTIVPSLLEPEEDVQVINAGTGFVFERTGSVWNFRTTGDQPSDLWSPEVRTLNTGIGRAVAIAPTNVNLALVGSETPTGSDGSLYSFTYMLATLGLEPGQVPGPAGGVLDSGGSSGGGGGGTGGGGGGGGTGGAIPGGGAPSGATDATGGFTIPLMPIVHEWGLVKGSAVALGAHGAVSILQTDGVHASNAPRFRHLGTLPEGATFVGLGDMNADRSGDVIYISDTGVLRYWVRDEFTVTEDVIIDSLPAGAVVVAVADMDGDGKADIVMQDAVDSRAVTVWLMSGGGISSSVEYTLPDEGPWTVHVLPFSNGAGNRILLRNAATSDLRLLQEGDDGAVTYLPLRDLGPGYRLIGAGDMDSDGQPELWWQGKEVVLQFYQVQDDGSYAMRQRMRTSIDRGTVVDVRDWNGDGILDVWMRQGRRNYVLFLSWDGYVHMDRARDIGDAPGRVVGFAER